MPPDPKETKTKKHTQKAKGGGEVFTEKYFLDALNKAARPAQK